MSRYWQLEQCKGELCFTTKTAPVLVCVHALLCDSCFKQLVTLINGLQSGKASEHCDTPQPLLVVEVYGAVIQIKSQTAAFERNIESL